MSRRNLYTAVGGVIFLVVGAVVGFLTGSAIGGNYPDFVFWLWRGAEAAGWIGIVGGGFLGMVFGSFLGFKIADKRGV